MCVTEVWTFRECGCSYNHSVLCRPYRIQCPPYFAPDVQEPWDRQLEDSGENGLAGCEKLDPQIAPGEPQNCLNHRTLQKSFLNQICDDCLLTELDATTPVSPSYEETIDHPSALNPWDGEGLIWDSEVKIEIEGQRPESARSDAMSEPRQHHTQSVDEEGDEREIFESHIEILVEAPDHYDSADDVSSPDFTACHRSGHSPSTSSLETPSPPTMDTGRFRSVISSHNIKSMPDCHDNPTNVDDADDELEHRTDRLARNDRSMSRKRVSTRLNLRKVEERGSDTDEATQTINTKRSGRYFSGIPSLGAHPITFLSSLTAEDGVSEQIPSSDSLNILPSSRSRIKNPFRNLDARKSSTLPQIAGTWEWLPSSAPINDIRRARTQEIQPPVSRRSALKTFAHFLVQDLKRTLTIQSPGIEGGNNRWSPRRMALSKTDEKYEEGRYAAHPKSDCLTDTDFDNDSRPAIADDGSTSPIDLAGAAGTDSVSTSIPKSSTMHTLRAVINDLEVGLEIKK